MGERGSEIRESARVYKFAMPALSSPSSRRSIIQAQISRKSSWKTTMHAACTIRAQHVARKSVPAIEFVEKQVAMTELSFSRVVIAVNTICFSYWRCDTFVRNVSGINEHVCITNSEILLIRILI